VNGVRGNNCGGKEKKKQKRNKLNGMNECRRGYKE
jgi:hypothetical protein